MMTATPPRKITILGTGSWGLTLAWLLSQRNACRNAGEASPITLWGRNETKIQALRANRHVDFPVDVTLPEDVELTSCLTTAIQNADVVLFVVTAKATREVADAIKQTEALKPGAILVNASKGIEYPSLQPMSSVLHDVFPHHAVGVLSGPTLAKEVLAGLPTACTISAETMETAEMLQEVLNYDKQFRLYTNTDITGVELAGSLKNVFAIASGFMGAKGMGDNAKAALLTRGLAEMARFCLTQGADESTIYGLAGLGDMLATCSSPLSRNFQVGFRLGRGETLEDILRDMKVVAEGVHTARAVYAMSQALKLDMPIVQMVVGAVSGTPISSEMMIKSLMARKLKAETSSAI
jgi:glycerol-3-phosphate dehydrogenase (NAD(P)+)